MFASKDTLLTRPSGYQIQRSLRFRSSASAYLSRTPATASNRKTWTWSGWVKRGALGVTGRIFAADDGSGSTDQDYNTLFFTSSDQIKFAGNLTDFRTTTAVYRDPSAWYHIVFVTDTTQATAANRFKLYVNGSEVTAFGTSNNPSQNTDLAVNASIGHYIGSIAGASYLDGYLTEINFIDGQALTPSSFGAINPVTGVWSATKYAGTYGTNGFYLNFSDNSAATATTIGKDYSGNGNNWTPNNISVTAGSTYDSMLDAPLGAGGGERGNYAVFNPLAKALSAGGTGTTSNGNLTIAFGATNWYGHKGSIAVSSGKWYYEVVNTSGTTFVQAGFTLTTVESETATGVYRYRSNGNKVSTAYVAYGAAWSTAGDIAGIAFDADTGEITFYKNGVSQGSAFTSIPAGLYAPEVIVENATTANVNFGQRPFSYTPPTGFKALHTGNLAAPVIVDGGEYFDASLYSGNSSTVTVTNSGFQPDLVWIKDRSAVASHVLTDAVRGVTQQLFSNLTNAEQTNSTYVTSFNSDGFTVGVGNSGTGVVNNSGDTFVGWQWKAGGTAVTNTAGSITSSVSANTTAGFSVVTYTGTGSNATVGHGLGVAPSMVIVKRRDATGAWTIGFTFSGFNWASDYFQFDTAAKRTDGAGTIFTTAPSSTVFSIGTDGSLNANASPYVAYCFAPVAGYSAFGSYTGNGSGDDSGNGDGPFVFLGFRPRFVMVKSTTSGTANWAILDTSRAPYNNMRNEIWANSSSAEESYAAIDALSNGFKLRSNSGQWNASGGTYIYMAFAESPFKNSLAR